MLKQIRIQNYKSLKDVTLDLEQVNLFIGPNNSGKSNVLKAIEFFSHLILHPNNLSEVSNYTFNREESSIVNPSSITMLFSYEEKNWLYKLDIWKDYSGMEFIEVAFNLEAEKTNFLNINFLNIDTWGKYFKEGILNSNSGVFKEYCRLHFRGLNQPNNNSLIITKSLDDINYSIRNESYNPGVKGALRGYSFLHGTFEHFLKNLFIYKPDIGLIKHPIKNKENLELNFLEDDCYNLAEFIFNFSQNHKKNYNEFIADFKNCVHEFDDISTPYDPNDNTKTSLKLKFFDNKGIGYWIDEVSDGVIYFLALLAIIHQPSPPKILMLEEPETGIHPRRIKEIIDYIFKLGYEKNIQIILTSHSPLILDKFNSIPQNVTVFDKENGETKIKNLQRDIIEVNNQTLLEKGLKEINYTASLGEHWLDGFIGGIPDEND